MNRPAASTPLRRTAALSLFATCMLLTLAAVPARAVEIIPSVGMTRAVDGNDDAVLSAGLALRGQLIAPFLQDEVAIGYHTEDRFADQLHVRMWPVTASLWVSPVPALYAGGGVGFYNITLDYDEDTIGQVFEDETRQEFGVHLGGGVRVPVGTRAAVDLGGRYVMMRDQEDRLVPDHFDPDFWTANLGLAIRF